MYNQLEWYKILALKTKDLQNHFILFIRVQNLCYSSCTELKIFIGQLEFIQLKLMILDLQLQLRVWKMLLQAQVEGFGQLAAKAETYQTVDISPCCHRKMHRSDHSFFYTIPLHMEEHNTGLQKIACTGSLVYTATPINISITKDEK